MATSWTQIEASMSIQCEELEAIFKDFSLVKECDTLPDGTLRMATLFQYPDGSFIDVFLQEEKGLPDSKKGLFRAHLLSDCGQTTSYLLDLGIKLWATKRRKEALSDICESLNVETQKGELQVGVEADGLHALPDAIVKLVQACIRVADFSLTQHFPAVATFRDDVEAFIDAIPGLNFVADPTLRGRFDQQVTVDFRVEGKRKVSLLKTISTNNPFTAHTLFNEAHYRWDSLSGHRGESQFVTVVDDKADLYRPEDFARQKEVVDAVIVFPPEQERLKRLLSA